MFQTGQQVQSKAWEPQLDAGKHHRARLGFILMSTDLAAESDFFAMAPEGVAVLAELALADDVLDAVLAPSLRGETLDGLLQGVQVEAQRVQKRRGEAVRRSPRRRGFPPRSQSRRCGA